ncbi:hypothetical protein JCM33374_g4431 [Metschnikowia sp. JCM 33374]|nr:hypothetical protein JCM33374_g4431 [Metschnikowia sp. JCM 33374]
MHCSTLSELASSMAGGDNPKGFRVSLTKEKLSQLSVAKSHSIYELPVDEVAMNTRPWKNSPKYFTQVLISTVALVKMSAHAKSGGSIEVMGMLTGKIVRNSFIVMDVYSLPVEGTETRVNAQNEAYEFMVQYLDNLKEVKPNDSILGWYHSHPGYGCWLSGIDVATQSLNQKFQDPYLAIVVDPARSSNQGKVEIGAFRTFPVGYVDGTKKKENDTGSAVGTKGSAQDMGAHSDQYYSLDIKLFKGPQDDEIVNSILDKSWISGIVQNTSCGKNYEEKVAQNIECAMKVTPVANDRANTSNSNRYERLFERIVSLPGTSSKSLGSSTDAQTEGSDQSSVTEGINRLVNEQSYDVDMEQEESEDVRCEEYFDAEDEDEDDDDDDDDNEAAEDAEVDADNDTESRIGLEGNEDEEDAQSVRTRDPGDPGDAGDIMSMAQDSDEVSSHNPSEPGQLEDMGLFEEYEAGQSTNEEIQKKGLKRNLRTSSEESKSCVPFVSSLRERRKRFAPGELGSAVDNELKHKMQSLQLELQRHVKEAKSIGQAELLKLAARRAQHRVFGQQNLRDVGSD